MVNALGDQRSTVTTEVNLVDEWIAKQSAAA